MPTPAAREAFEEAKRLTAQMGMIQTREQAVREAMQTTGDREQMAELDKELVGLHAEWLRLSEAYTQAIGRFMEAVEAARNAD